MRVDKKIGVLLVHGIGEQKRFEHLGAEVRNFARALASEHQSGGPGRGVTVEIAPGSSSGFLADKESWRADRVAPVQVLVRSANGSGDETVTSICFHEVWWADLDEPVTLWSQIRFWFWGLSMWMVAGKDDPDLDGFAQMRLPGPREEPMRSGTRWALRLRLLLIATVFLVATGSVTLVNFIARRLNFGYLPGSATFVNFVGDVKLYRQQRRHDRGPLTDLDQPPRAAIRRRMVTGIVDMAAAGYDRWYILAHSLGSVVAFNALMETAHCLPNFLDRRRWGRLLGLQMAGPGRDGTDWPHRGNEPPPVGNMLPRRPMWLADDCVVYREKLFAKLRGVVTYGSPLDKFATIWPALVPLNRMEAVFSPDCEWINVYDPTDPVGARLDFFDPATRSADADLRPLRVENYGYRASPLLLISHIKYLQCKPNTSGWLAHAVAEWMLKGCRFKDVRRAEEKWIATGSGWLRSAWRYFQWVLVGLGVAWLTAWFLEPVPELAATITANLPVAIRETAAWVTRPVEEPIEWVASEPLWVRLVAIFALSVVICLASGVLRWLLLRQEAGAPRDAGARATITAVARPASHQRANSRTAASSIPGSGP